MSEIACVNGAFMPLAEAVVPVEDRGFQFADGVYEVIATYGGVPYAMEEHLVRLERSLRELRIAADVRDSGLDLKRLVADGMARAGFAETLVYIQITRGVAPRHHEFPSTPTCPTLVMTFKALARPPAELYDTGVRAVTRPDLRWKRCDIKTTGLLPNSLAKEEARASGAFEALLFDDAGRVTEGSSTSAFRACSGTVFTSPVGPHMLPSITRAIMLRLAGELAIPVREESSTRADFLEADEVFLAGTTTEIMPVVEIDGTAIGDGTPGPLARQLREALLKTV